MPVKGPVAVVMFDDDGVAVTAVNSGEDDASPAGGAERGPDRDRYVDPAVKDELAAPEGIRSPPHPGSDYAVRHRQVKVRAGCKR